MEASINLKILEEVVGHALGDALGHALSAVIPGRICHLTPKMLEATAATMDNVYGGAGDICCQNECHSGLAGRRRPMCASLVSGHNSEIAWIGECLTGEC